MNYLSTNDAPLAIGPYSQGVASGSFIFTSGQVPLDPATASLVEGDFEVSTRRVFENLRAVLHSAGATFDNVVKVTVYLSDMNSFNVLNSVYSEYMGAHKPARTTVEVAALPLGAPVEIDMIAILEG